MKLVFRRFAFFAIFLGSGVVACPGVGDVETKDGRQLVKASLVTDVCAIQSGQKFRIGVLYQIEPGWHIYWKHSGDSGIPTKIDWKLPVGFKVGQLQWPLPIRDKEPGDLEVFGYDSEVLLFADVEAPKDLTARPIELRAKSDWLVCQSSCIPGSAELSAELNIGPATVSPSAAIFDKYAKEVPKQLPSQYKAVFSRRGKNLQLAVEGAPAGTPLDFFPDPPEASVIGHASQTANKVTLPIDTERQPINRLDGVLVIGTGSDRQGFEITAAAAPSEPESFPARALGRSARAVAGSGSGDSRRTHSECDALRFAGDFVEDFGVCP
jgi:thiol:disulfide interchange protein DsbD